MTRNRTPKSLYHGELGTLTLSGEWTNEEKAEDRTDF
jgi:hypothetical protein